MRNLKSVGLVLVLVLALGANGMAGEKPARQILGLRLGMNPEQAHARLKELGQSVRDEAQRQEVWTVRDPSFSHVLIGFTKKDEVRYITAVAREDKEAKRVRYTEIGDLDKARQAGDAKIKVFNYQWTLPTEKGEPETLVVALGREADYLNTYSLKRLGAAVTEEKD